eukprot:COSAG06_NODE_9284_length_1939_cov_1.044022_1_plen_195_part_00
MFVLVGFYQQRLPTYYRIRTVSELLLVTGSLSGTLLAFLGLAQWNAIVTSIGAVITAWLAFHGTRRKLTRYSTAVDSIVTLIGWWNGTFCNHAPRCFPGLVLCDTRLRGPGLDVMEQQNVEQINKLIVDSEELFERERGDWHSAAGLQSKQLAGKYTCNPMLAVCCQDSCNIMWRTCIVCSNGARTSGLVQSKR